ADDEHVPARRRGRLVERPAALHRLVAEEPFDRIDADWRIEASTIAPALAGVIADPSHDRREGVVLDQVTPRGFVVAGLRMEEPALDVLAGGTFLVARRQVMHVHRPLGA